MGNRARHRSSIQASSAGMKLYYKGMLAVHLENGAVTTRTLPIPPRPEGFALLRLLAGGICNTDLELQRGYYGFAGTPGHEFVAEVVEADTRVAHRQARGGRNQPGLHALRMVPQRPGPPLPQPHRAGNRQAPRRLRRILHPAGTQPAHPPRRHPHRAAPSSPSRWPPPARFWTRCRFRPASASPCWAMANWAC